MVKTDVFALLLLLCKLKRYSPWNSLLRVVFRPTIFKGQLLAMKDTRIGAMTPEELQSKCYDLNRMPQLEVFALHLRENNCRRSIMVIASLLGLYPRPVDVCCELC